MRYSSDLHIRVLDFIESDGSKAEASRRFRIFRPTIDKWLKTSDPLRHEKPGTRGPTHLTRMRSKPMLMRFQTKRLLNARVIYRGQRSAFGMV